MRSSEYPIHTPIKLIFTLPEQMSAGTYCVEVKTAYQQTDILRTGSFEKLLKVV